MPLQSEGLILYVPEACFVTGHLLSYFCFRGNLYQLEKITPKTHAYIKAI